LVVKIAYDYRRAHRQIPDLIQEGNVGLMQAVKKYDPYKGVKLSTYAAWWIRAYILRFILNNARLVKLGTTQAQRKLFFNLRKEKAKLSAMGIEPTPEVIAERLDVTTDEVIQRDRRLAAGDASLDSPMRVGEENAPSRIETLSYDGARVDDILADNEMHALFRGRIAEFGKKLTGKDQRIFEARMLTEEPLTLQQLGEEFGVSRERVRQLEKRLHGKLRDYLAAELGEEAMES
jgi:RNA polymerase sigma-32 factor